MGSAISRCTSRTSTPVTPGLTQKILDNQPNWLVMPSRWRSNSTSHEPVRYRTPTPYPKDDRKPLPEQHQHLVHNPEKTHIIETNTSAKHIEAVKAAPHQHLKQAQISQIQLPPPATITITWECHPRLNRFERIV